MLATSARLKASALLIQICEMGARFAGAANLPHDDGAVILLNTLVEGTELVCFVERELYDLLLVAKLLL